MIKYRDLVTLVRLSNSLKEFEEATESKLDEGILWTFAKDNWEQFRSTVTLSGSNIKAFVNCMSLIINEHERIKSIKYNNDSDLQALITKIKESSDEDALVILKDLIAKADNDRDKCNDIMINYFYEERFKKNIIIANPEKNTPKDIVMDLRKIRYKRLRTEKQEICNMDFGSLLRALSSNRPISNTRKPRDNKFYKFS